jgi:TP901 family phage tail tape measure protein/lambda family phage tail tape measure protein
VSVVANVAINVDSRNAVSKLRQVQTQAQSTEKAFGALQSAIGALGVGFALTKVIADVKELDTNLRRLGTVGGNVAALDKGLGALSDRLGGVANKAELAAASYQALSAGFTETGANLRVVEAATKAAVGGLVDVTAATEVTTKVLNAYNMSGDQATKVTDSIAKSIEYGVIQWSDYTSQLGRVASVSAIAGVSLDEVNAFISSATKNSATAEIAFTGLGATLSNMLKPTKESADAAKALGINWNLSGIRGEGFESLMGKLGKAMQENPVLANKMVGGQEAVRGAFAAASKGGKDYAMILEGLGGAADKTDADFQTMKGSLENTLKALDTSFKNLSEALGIAFGPTVVKTITDTAAAINIVADALNAMPQPLKSATGEAAKFVIQMLLVQKAIQAIIALRAAFIGAMAAMTGATVASGAAATTSAGAFALYTNNARTLQATSVAATASVSGLAGALLGLAGIGIITVGINYVITQTGAIIGSSTAAGKSEAAGTAGGLAAQLKGKSAAERKQMLAAAQKNLANDKKLASALALQIQMQDNAALSSSERALPSDRSRLTELQARINTNQARIKAIQTTPIERAKPTPTPTPTTATGDGNDDAKRAAEKKRRAAEELANLQGQVTLKEKLFGIDKQIAVEKERGSLVTAAALEMDKALEERQARIAEITRSTADTATKNAQIKEATLDADQKIYAVQQAIKEQEAERTKSFDAIIADLNLELALKTATTEQERERLRIEAARAKLQADLKGQGFQQPQIDQITGLQAQVAAPLTDVQKIDQQVGKLKDEIAELTSISNIAITSAEGIGNAFAQSFQGLISGSMTAKEALGSFFKSVADMFLEMAAQIIAKQMTMIILQTILKALGVVGGGTATAANPEAYAVGTGAAIEVAAKGASFANGIAKFASGGIVSSPTLFKFADGGTTRTGLMGEAGPEAILPLTRGPGGQLGVSNFGGSGDVNVVVNVDAKGSSVEGNEQGANQLGRVISAAVQSELIKQQRPGGILAR